jgi:thiol-disulfide isomerase/thioredoxin
MKKTFVVTWTALSMRFQVLILAFMTTLTMHAQDSPAHTPNLKIGDMAPGLQLRGADEWLKGSPVSRFKKGEVYVIEFWATWCKPCLAGMPHLSTLAHKYAGKVTFIAIDIYERKMSTYQSRKALVDSMRNQMDFAVAADDSNAMVTAWINAAADQGNGIPRSFVVDADGRLAWIGYPQGGLEDVLTSVVHRTWNLKTALANRNSEKRMDALADSMRYVLNSYEGDARVPGNRGKPDSGLLVINRMVVKEPGLKYASGIAFHTFSFLLKTNPSKAYAYGKELIKRSSYTNPLFDQVFDALQFYTDKFDIPAELFRLGASACWAHIHTYPQTADLDLNYGQMGEWYWRAGDKSKAILAGKLAVEAKKKEKYPSKLNFSLATLKFRLRQYEGMRFKAPQGIQPIKLD